MVTRLDLAYDRSVHRVRTRLLGFAGRYWNGLGSWRDSDYERLVQTLVPRIESGQQKVAGLTDAYIQRLAIAEFGEISAGAVAQASTEALRGVPASEVYHRPFVSTYAALNEGKSVTASVAAGAERVAALVTTGVQLAKTHAAREAIGRSRFQGFQRTLTGRENCALCVIASTQRYRVGVLLPIHPGCDCGVKPFYARFDQQVINPSLLEESYVEIATQLEHVRVGRGARDLGISKTDARGRPISDFTDLIVTDQHGEIGPILSWRSHEFTSAADIAALTN